MPPWIRIHSAGLRAEPPETSLWLTLASSPLLRLSTEAAAVLALSRVSTGSTPPEAAAAGVLPTPYAAIRSSADGAALGAPADHISDTSTTSRPSPMAARPPYIKAWETSKLDSESAAAGTAAGAVTALSRIFTWVEIGRAHV